MHTYQLNRFAGLLTSLLCAGTLLTACNGGGGGSTDTTSSEPTVMTGKLVPLIEGIAFSTPSESGTTDAEGQFTYRTGEMIEFKLGSTTLGMVNAKSELTIFDLAQTTVLTGTQNLVNAVSTPSTTHSGLDYTLPHPDIRWRPFHLAMNRLLFLHSLDRDQNPLNGVQINSSMAALLVDVTVRFNQNWRKFRDILTVRKARVNGQELGAFDAPLVQVSYPAILDAAYAAMGVSPNIFNMTKQYYFEDSGIEYEYNDNDMLVRRTGWEDQEYRYDEYDNMIWRQDECGIITESPHDATGNLVGLASPYSITTFEYDKYGSLVRREEDKWLDGTIDNYTAVELDEQGRPVRIEEESGGSLLDTLELIRYDNRDNRVRWEQRLGESADIHIQRFDANSQLIWREHRDESGNHSQQEWEYDARGYVVASTMTFYESDQLIRKYHQTFNHRGDVTRWERYEHGSSTGLSIISRSWDENGNETQRTLDTDGDGIAEKITHWEYDRGGNVTKTTIDSDADGTPDTVIPATVRYEYDERGNKVLIESKGSEGRIDWLTHFAYDDANNLILEDEEIGFYELTTRYEYKPMGWKGVFFARSRVSDLDLFDYHPCL